MPLFNASILASLLFATLLWAAVPAQADEIKDISQLISQNQHAQALDRLNNFLLLHPKDAQGQFLKGVVLAEENKPAEAIRIFTDLTEKHPELPEPYNNLAVLYADQGQYDKARHALEMAIKTHPSYATAHENLGDIYAKMASDAYDKALQLDKVNARAQTKLAMIKDLFTNTAPKPAASKPEEARKSAVVPVVATPTPAPAAVVAAQKTAKPVTPATPPAAVSEMAKMADKPAAPIEEPRKEEPKKGEPTAKEDHKEAVLVAVHNWAKAWSAKNVDNYLASYADNFKTPNGESRKAWEQSRKERIHKPEAIKVEVLNPKVKIDGNRASVTFRQLYRSGDNAKRTVKTLIMKKTGATWLIEQEQTDR